MLANNYDCFYDSISTLFLLPDIKPVKAKLLALPEQRLHGLLEPFFAAAVVFLFKKHYLH